MRRTLRWARDHKSATGGILGIIAAVAWWLIFG